MPDRARQNQPECQVLFELFGSPRGRVSLGRLSTGSEAGRIVVLREIREGALPEVTPAFELAKGLTHPRLLKLLGVVSDRTHSYVASEYVPGISLFELVARARARQSGLEVGAAVRVMTDALRAIVSARALLRGAGAQPVRLLNSDCIWLVDYGETLLSEVGVSAALLGGTTQRAPDTASNVQARDLMSAAVELYQLASGRLMAGDLSRAAKLHLPTRLAQVLEEAFTWQPSSSADGVSDLVDALAGLPPALVGSEQLVASELQRLSGDLLAERRRKLAAFHSAGADVEGATRVFVAVPAAEEEAAEEATLAAPGKRRAVPFMLAVPQALSALRPLARAQAKEQPPRRPAGEPLAPRATQQRSNRRVFGFTQRERWLLALWLALVLGGIAWQRPDWLSSAKARLLAWKEIPASQRPASVGPSK